MPTNRNSSARFGTLALAAVLLTGVTGCKGTTPTVDDPTLTSQVQQRIASDGALANEPVQVMAQAGVITLTGSVSNAAARSLAANDAAVIPGVQKVVNNITVNAAAGPATTTTTAQLQQPQTQALPAPRERVRQAPPSPLRRPSRETHPRRPSAPPYVAPQAPTIPAAPRRACDYVARRQHAARARNADA